MTVMKYFVTYVTSKSHQQWDMAIKAVNSYKLLLSNKYGIEVKPLGSVLC